MKKQITINWWTDGDIKDNHLEALEEAGFNRAFEMVQQGYTSGELADNIHMDDDDPEDGIQYYGHWTLTDAPDYKLIQLYNVDGQEAGLYQYDANKINGSLAIEKVKQALIQCEDEDDPQDAADEVLSMHGIERVSADMADTKVI